jgi:hypothetical protein
MIRYYIPKTSWYDYHDMSTPIVMRAVEMAGGKDIRLELDCRTRYTKVVTFGCEQTQDLSQLRKALGRVLNNDSISVYEYKK